MPRKVQGVKKLPVRRGDTVIVQVGKDKGKKGKVLTAYPSTGRIVVEGVNMVTKHKKPRGQQDPGGIIHQEAPIHASNVLAICPSCHQATRRAHKIVTDNSGNAVKHRVCKKCGDTFND